MAYPRRFAPTGRRPTQFVPSGGLGGIPRGLPSGVGGIPRGLPPLNAPAPLIIGPSIDESTKGLFGAPAGATNIRGSNGLRSIYQRPMSTLGAIFRVLGVGENVAVGMLQSQYEDIKGLADDPLSPWVWLNAATQLDNFKEIGDSVKQNRTYEQWIRESQDPNSFLYRNAFVVGLGLSIFGDPTTYITFGATGASKTAAQRVLAATVMSSHNEAITAKLTGVIARTGEATAEYGNDYDRILWRIHTAAGRPATTGDAMEGLRLMDKGKYPFEVDPEFLAAVGVRTERGPIRQFFRGRFARGGQGIRFAGAEIPGTRGLGGKIVGAFGKVPRVPEPSRASFYNSVMKNVIPDAKLKSLTDDQVRAVAMLEFNRIGQEMGLGKTGAYEDALELFGLDPVKATKLAGTEGYKVRAATAIRNIFDNAPPAVPRQARLNLFKPGFTPTGFYGNALKSIRDEAYATRDRLIAEAEDFGMTEQQITGLNSLWDDYAKTFDDPLDVMLHWQGSVTATLAADRHISQLLMNPAIARPMIDGADELKQLDAQIADLNPRINAAMAKVTEAEKLRAVDMPKYTDEVIQTESWMPNVHVRTAQDWTAVFTSDDPMRIPTDAMIRKEPWRQFGRVYTDPDTGRIVISAPGIDHEDTLMAVTDSMRDKDLYEEMSLNWMQGTVVFEKGKVAKVNFLADIEGNLKDPVAMGIITKARSAQLTEQVKQAFEDLYKTMGPKRVRMSNRTIAARKAHLRGLQQKSQALADNYRVVTRRMKDAEGETVPSGIIAYHGTESLHDEVKLGMEYEPGLFASSSVDVAKGYGEASVKTLEIPPQHVVGIDTRLSKTDASDIIKIIRKLDIDHMLDKMPEPPVFNTWADVVEFLQQNVALPRAHSIGEAIFEKMKVGAVQYPGQQESTETWIFSKKLLDQALNPPTRPRPLIGAVNSEEQARRIFHENAVPFKWKGQKWLVPAPIAMALEDFKNPQLVDKEIRRFFRGINYTQNKWKIAATSLNPSFHVMNSLGGVWNNLLGGVYNPGDYVEQLTGMYRQRIARMPDDSLIARGLAPMRGRIDPDKLARDREMLDAYEARHVGGGFVTHEVHPEYQEMKRAARTYTPVGKAFQVARRTYAGGAIGLTIAPDAWVPDEIQDSPLFSPIAGVVAGLPELARAGRYLANDVETTLRETPLRAAAKDPSYYQLLDAYSVMPPVHFGKWMGETDIGKAYAARELVWDIGAANAIRYQFDYSKLTTFERYIAKTIFPFYTFNKNNFVLQAQELANRPRFLATVSDVMNFSNYMTANEDNEQFQYFLPEYFDKIGMFRVPVPHAMREMMGLPQDQDLYLNPKLPYATLNLFPPLWEVFNDESLTPPNTRWLQMLAPLFGSIGPNSVLPGFKPMVEYSVGYNLGLARPIDYQAMTSGGWRHSYREAPGFMKYLPSPIQDWMGAFKDPKSGQLMMNSSMAYIAESMATPFISSTGDVFNWSGTGPEADRIKANNFSFLTGIRLTPVDPIRLQRSFLYRTENFLEGQKAEAKRRGVPFSTEDNLLLIRVRAQLKRVEASYDRQQNALYGGP